MKLPKLKMPQLVTRRPVTNETLFIGLTGGEWGISCFAITVLYSIFAGYFAILLILAQTIRNGGDYYVVPGTEDSLKPVPENKNEE